MRSTAWDKEKELTLTNRWFYIFVISMCLSQACLAQVGGGSVYAQGQGTGKSGAEQNERAKRTIAADEKPPSATSIFLDASVLINVEADEYVATFGISQEGVTLQECRQKSQGTIDSFCAELKSLGVNASDIAVDFVAQNRIYGYEVSNDIAKEKLTGFELKKNVSIHYKGKQLLDRLVAAAAQFQIFDLIKVDYIVRNIGAVHTRLMEAAASVIKQKAANHGRLLGVRLQKSPQIYAEKYSSYSPTEMYDSYTAFESEDVNSGYYRQKYIIQGVRKSRTFYYNGLGAKSFDQVINPIVLEPMVQFTLYLKLKYIMEQEALAPAKSSSAGKHGVH
jgi:uncharacterized protein YggE